MFAIFVLRCPAAAGRRRRLPPDAALLCRVCSCVSSHRLAPLPRLQHVLAVPHPLHPVEAGRRRRQRRRGGGPAAGGLLVPALWLPAACVPCLLVPLVAHSFMHPALVLPLPARPLQVVKTWSSKGGKGEKEGLAQRLRGTFGSRMMLAWLLWALILWCARRGAAAGCCMGRCGQCSSVAPPPRRGSRSAAAWLPASPPCPHPSIASFPLPAGTSSTAWATSRTSTPSPSCK